MKKVKKLFEGCATALITPFLDDGVDFPSLRALIERQIEGGVSAVVLCGTTGEAPTLSEKEWQEVCAEGAECIGGRVPLIVGCGSNSTFAAARKASLAEGLGADGVLVVTPYYNKASREGMIRHFREVAAATYLPVIAYNVPSRTGVDLDVPACGEILKIPNVCGIKEASGSVSRAACLISEYGDSLPVYSGCDDVNLPILSIGGSGAISVLSNIFPEEVSLLCRLTAAGDLETAAALSRALHPLAAALFSEVNPIPVKTLLSHLGYCREIFRLPMCGMGEDKRERLISAYRETLDRLGK